MPLIIHNASFDTVRYALAILRFISLCILMILALLQCLFITGDFKCLTFMMWSHVCHIGYGPAWKVRNWRIATVKNMWSAEMVTVYLVSPKPHSVSTTLPNGTLY
jgi:hypothetical protein